MDFGTMQDKLTQGKYATMEDFAKDVQLVFNNCRTFNPPTTYPVNCADTLEKLFKKEWAKAMDKKLPPGEKKQLVAMMRRLIDEPLYVYLYQSPSRSCSLNQTLSVHGCSEIRWTL